MAHYKDKEFKAFIRAIDEGNAGHWVEIARALNISEDTIVKWKKEPEAQEAIRRGIDIALKGMEKAGAKDWRMYEARLKMLGVNPAHRIDLNVADPVEETLKKLGLIDAGKDKGTEKEAS